MKFEWLINLKHAVATGLGFFLTAQLSGQPVKTALLCGLLGLLGGSLNDVASFNRNCK